MDYYKKRRVTVPPGELDGMVVERFIIPKESIEGMRMAWQGRGCEPGTYTRLMENGKLWMSDTDAEIGDHLEAIHLIERSGCSRVLINGLGLGVVLKAALAAKHVKHIDVVEIDERVIKLVGPHYANKRLTIHHADAYLQAKKWPSGSHWDVIWHDIWPNLCEDNLPEMAKLHRSYGKRCNWQDSWGKQRLTYQKERYARSGYGW